MQKNEIIAEYPLFKNGDDPTIRWADQWVRTGNVADGEIGPGCPVGCGYCNQMSLNMDEAKARQTGYIFPMDSGIGINTRLMIGSRIDRFIEIPGLLSQLDQYSHYTRNTPLILENNNDPGVNWQQTINLIERLVDGGHIGPLVFITKMGISKDKAQRLGNLIAEKKAKIIGVITFSNMPQEIEPVPHAVRLKTMRQLKENKVPVIMSIRPLVEGINGIDEKLRELFAITEGLPDVYTIGGLHVYPEVIEQFASAGYPLPATYTEFPYPIAKTFPERLKQLVKEVAGEMGVTTPIMDHTSCAISRIMTTQYHVPTPDRMAYWAGFYDNRFAENCGTYCVREQIAICKATSELPREEILRKAKAHLEKIGYPGLELVSTVDNKGGTVLIVDGSLPFEEIIGVKQACGWDVINLPSKGAVEYRTRQACDQVGAEYDSAVYGSILVGQEWYIFTTGNLDGVENRLFIRWLRYFNRARMQIIGIEQLSTDDGVESVIQNLVSNSHDAQSRESIEEEVMAIRNKMDHKN